ncbi:uncharacterized protein [Nicotiana tomentosiformis]|uniref:uncharacterized protein n=1 Tax=Nicotiana tomentosiformis TaxID=4098 RepID=UPI00388CEA48
MYMLLSEQHDETLKDLQAELDKAKNEALILTREHADLVEKVKVFEAKNEKLVVVTNNTTSQKETTKAELASVDNQLPVANDKDDKWSQLNDDLRAQLSLVVAERDVLGREYEALKSKLDTTSADAEDMVSLYKDNVEAAETGLKIKTEYVKRLS